MNGPEARLRHTRRRSAPLHAPRAERRSSAPPAPVRQTLAEAAPVTVSLRQVSPGCKRRGLSACYVGVPLATCVQAAGHTAWAGVDLGQKPVDEVSESLHRVASVRRPHQCVLDEYVDRIETRLDTSTPPSEGGTGIASEARSSGTELLASCE